MMNPDDFSSLVPRLLENFRVLLFLDLIDEKMTVKLRLKQPNYAYFVPFAINLCPWLSEKVLFCFKASLRGSKSRQMS